MSLYGTVDALASRGVDGVIVAVSRGKDSLVILDMACARFRRVEAFFMYMVPGLSFADGYLDYLSRRYGVTIDQTPHWRMSHVYRAGVLRPLARTVPNVTIRDVQAAQRERTGLRWILSGEKACDSLQRRGMLTSLAEGGKGGAVLDDRAGVAYPVAWWNDRAVYQYLKHRRVPLPPDYRVLKTSFCSQLDGHTMSLMREHIPDDYKKVEAVFPFVGAGVLQYRLRCDADARSAALAQAADVRGAADGPEPDRPAPAQPADHRPPRAEAAAGEPGP